MSEHPELELAPAYALGALDEGERAAFEAHLPGCPSCQEAVAAAAPALGGLGAGARPEALPAGAAERLVAAFRREKAAGLLPGRPAPASARPASSASGSRLVAGALALVLAGMSVAAWQLRRGYDAERARADQLEQDLVGVQESLRQSQDARHELQDRSRALEADLARCREHGKDASVVARLLSDPARVRALKPARTSFAGTAAFAFDPETRAVVVAGGALPAPPAGKVYKLWALVKGAPAPEPLAAFDPREGAHVDRAPAGDIAGFAVSLEDAPGNAAKPTDVVLVPG